jgi:2-C-methyl-D-erythritol 4-phosphate cytidylyltransferase
MHLSSTDTFWAIIPAAGIGARIGTQVPKQYLLLHKKPIIAHSIASLSSHPKIHKIVVVLAANDTHWPLFHAALPPACAEKIVTVLGGATRQLSVYQGLLALQKQAKPMDWVLVHDAVRPFLQQTDIHHLMTTLQDNPVGGLLGIRVRDTLKRTDQAAQVISTLDREEIWQAQTPQMFRYGLLRDALQSAIEKKQQLTDEAMAIEKAGMRPCMIEGPLYNMKITYPEDIAYAEKYAFLERGI